jgi:hypothetical protein
MLSVGSRQAFIGVFFVLIISLLIKHSFKTILISAIIVGLIYNYGDVFSTSQNITNNKYNLKTVSRIIDAINSSDQNERIIIWNSFLKKSNLFPSGVFFGNSTKWIDQPHNFFVEYIYVCGFIFGIPFMFLVFKLIKFCAIRSPIIGSLMLYYFIPFNVSSGMTAAKYFFFFTFLVLGVTTNKIRIN